MATWMIAPALGQQSVTLTEICRTVYFPRKLDTGPITRRQYAMAITDFGRCLGREPTAKDLTDDNLLLWTRALLDREPPLSRWTINALVGRLKALWNWLGRRGYLTTLPTIKPLAVPEPTPRAWTLDELAALFHGADLEGGLIAEIPARLWWQARIAFHWWCGARKGEGDALRQDWVDLNRGIATIPAIARKGRRKPATYHLPLPLVQSLAAIWLPRRALVFPWPFDPTTYWLRWNRILKHAGLPPGRRSKTQALRISFATWQRQQGADASRALMHSDPMTTARFYLDRSFETPPKPLPDPRQRTE